MPDAPREAMFYHLERSGVEDALPELLEKTLERGKRALVRSTDSILLGRLDERLWSWREESFLAHGFAGEPAAARQPILLTTGDENENGADFLFMLDEPPAALERFERCVLMFSGDDEAGLTRARSLWKQWKTSGASVAYHQQTEEGRMGAPRLSRRWALGVLALLAACAETTPRPAIVAKPPPPDLSAAPIASPPPPIPKPRSQCGLEELDGLVGKPTTDIPVPVYPGLRRVICTTCPRTEEYSPTRQTIEFDQATGLVTAMRCG